MLRSRRSIWDGWGGLGGLWSKRARDARREEVAGLELRRRVWQETRGVCSMTMAFVERYTMSGTGVEEAETISVCSGLCIRYTHICDLLLHLNPLPGLFLAHSHRCDLLFFSFVSTLRTIVLSSSGGINTNECKRKARRGGRTAFP